MWSTARGPRTSARTEDDGGIGLCSADGRWRSVRGQPLKRCGGRRVVGMARCVWKCAAITRVLPTSLTPEYPPPPNVLTPTPAEVQRASDGALSTALHVLRQPNSNAIANVLSPSHSRCPFGDARRPSVRLRRSIPSSICACALRPAAALGGGGSPLSRPSWRHPPHVRARASPSPRPT